MVPVLEDGTPGAVRLGGLRCGLRLGLPLLALLLLALALSLSLGAAHRVVAGLPAGSENKDFSPRGLQPANS